MCFATAPMMLMNFGFRLAAWHMTAETAESKALEADTLQMIYEIRNS